MAAQARPARAAWRACKICQGNDTGLGELLEKYGFKIGQDFVLDPQAAAPA